MDFFWKLYAAVLLSMPPGAPLPRLEPTEAAWQGIVATAHDLEIVDQDTSWSTDWAFEVNWCRSHCRVAAQAPPLTDTQRLPSPFVAGQYLDCARSRLQWLNLQMVGNPGYIEQLRPVYKDQEWRCEVWMYILDAAADTECHGAVAILQRRGRLLTLRDMIGQEAYYAGRWPCFVNIDTYQRMP